MVTGTSISTLFVGSLFKETFTLAVSFPTSSVDNPPVSSIVYWSLVKEVSPSFTSLTNLFRSRLSIFVPKGTVCGAAVPVN